MTVLAFGAYEPDKQNYQGGTSKMAQNVVPRADGYGPWKAFAIYSQALSAACRGIFYGRTPSGSVVVFAATSDRIFKLNNIDLSWTDVSKGGAAYTPLPSTDHWQFCQFGNLVIAVQQNTAPQVIDISGAATAFADLAGGPPQARYIAVVNRFVLLSGLNSFPYRIQWSGLNSVNAADSWTSGIAGSDFQDFADGGIVRGAAGGEYGVVFQDGVIRSMIYAVGSAYIFQFIRIAEDKGLHAPYSIIRSGSNIFFLASQGFHKIVGSTVAPIPIGKDKVDATFFGDYDASHLQYIIGTTDPQNTRVYWSYNSQAAGVTPFDKILVYDYVLERWSSILQNGEYLSTLAAPGITLEGLDAIAPGALVITGAANNGAGLIRITVASTSTLSTGQAKTISGVVGTTEANGTWTITVISGTTFDLQGSAFVHAYVSGGIVGGSLDALTVSLDDFSLSALPRTVAADTSHRLGFFSGPNVEATLDTAEQAITGKRARVSGLYPVTDAPGVFGAVGYRETLQVTVTYSTEQVVTARGMCHANVSTRLARARMRIPAATVWTYATGFEPNFVPEGQR